MEKYNIKIGEKTTSDAVGSVKNKKLNQNLKNQPNRYLF